MPGMTGLDVCEALKADPVLAARVPIIFATSHDPTILQVTAFQKGASDFVTKPLIAAQLTARVRAHLSAKHLIEDLQRDSLASGATPPLPGRDARLLIVDDDIASIHVLRHALAARWAIFISPRTARRRWTSRVAWSRIYPARRTHAGPRRIRRLQDPQGRSGFQHVPIVFITRFSIRATRCARRSGRGGLHCQALHPGHPAGARAQPARPEAAHRCNCRPCASTGDA